VAFDGAQVVELPEDSESLKTIVHSLIAERDREKQHAEQQACLAQEQKLRADQLHHEKLRLQQELERYKKWSYGPRADRLATSGDGAQMLLDFAGELDRKSVHPEDVPASAEPTTELRRVRRRNGRRNLANFDNLPVTTHVYELSAEERACRAADEQRREIGAEESWQVEYYTRPLRKRNSAPAQEVRLPGLLEQRRRRPTSRTAAKPETAIDKGWLDQGC
jgi:hypothetical protein